MIPVWALALGIVGLNFLIWGFIGLLRLVDDRLLPFLRRRRRAEPAGAEAPPSLDRVAVLMPAHNEEVVIADSLAAITALIAADQVHVVSDGSTDRTVELAREAGVNVISTATNVGKAGALQEAIARFDLVERYDAVLLLDADTRIQPGYFDAALPLFADPGVAAVAGAVRSSWSSDRLSLVGKILICHRQRIYALTQRLLKYGQTWARVNATHIVPGFASMYRTRVLPEIEMNPPGLVIEDFNMTFELYRRRLGRVGFSIKAVAETQDPDRLIDYVRQQRRWSLGLWQTVRRLPPRPSLFGLMLCLLLLELVTAALSFIVLPFLVLVLVLPLITTASLTWPVFGPVHTFLAAHLSLPALLFGMLAPDFLLTCLVVIIERRTRYLAAFLAFPIMRTIDAYLALRTFLPGMRRRSDGRWSSPVRRAVDLDEDYAEVSPERASELAGVATGEHTGDHTEEHAVPAGAVSIPSPVSAGSVSNGTGSNGTANGSANGSVPEPRRESSAPDAEPMPS